MNYKISSIFLFLLLLACRSHAQYSSFPTDSKMIYSICLTQSGEVLAAADGNTIKAFSTRSLELITEFRGGHKDQILAIDISADSTLLVSGGRDGLVVLWHFIDKRIIRSLDFSQGRITSLKISPSGKYLLAGSTDHKAYLYDISGNKLIREFADHSEVITSVAFSPDEKYFASSSVDKTIRLYDLESRSLITSLKAHRTWIRHISFSEYGTRLVSCGDDAKMIIWNISDIRNPEIYDKIKIKSSWLLSVDAHRENRVYALGSFNGRAYITGAFGRYSADVKSPVTQVLLMPNKGIYLEIIAATRGKGVLKVNARDMNLKSY